MTGDILLTIFLVLLNGFFVAAEFAIVKVRATQISSMKTVPSNVLKTAQKVVNNLDGYLAATQLGITLASLGLGWVGEEVTTEIILNTMQALNVNVTPELAHKISVPIAFLVITILHIVFGELAPKSFAIRKPAPTTLVVAVPLRIFYFVFRPFIWFLNGMANMILRIFGIAPMKEHEIHTEEELKLIISESQEGGAIEESERELIQNVFDFDDRRVRDILVHRKNIVALDADLPFDDFIDLALSEGYSRYPVYQNSIDNLIGVINTKDLYTGLHAHKVKTPGDIIRPVFYVPDSMKIKDLLRTFQQKHQQLAVVTNEFGDTSGIVTMEDILEELVGEIQDEHDHEQPIVLQTQPNEYMVNAHQNIDELNKYLPVMLPMSNHYNTLAGLISYKLEEIPHEGQTLTIGNYTITVTKMAKSSVETVKMVYK
ncbi:CBS domain containing-hemolysin-like protein [Chitinophaga skermanii]|uniref:CBS domain containing-hemolysin-like protein n=1 Tax=Chitinophaga skermanii TaxID=331697 RepID=A0A327R393_9BACT|nr:hemolysin family protein [Chitinophaga skermanii]RAJ11121.1 CBS domain containing-hemolysin-like protein [Chitinophaga skermanii]